MVHDPHPVDLMELIDRLEQQIVDGKRQLLTNRVTVDEAECLHLIQQLRATLPVELDQARRVIQERQKIFLDAQAEAEKIIMTARDRAEYLISEKGLTAEARYRSEDYLRQGRETSRKLMTEVDAYARRVLDDIERVMRANLDEMESLVSAKLADIERAKTTLSQQR
jgi:vacuolar-type H+-ATPase subunit H